MNNITEVADHILLPHIADWTRKPTLERIWKTGLEASLGGSEDRASVRHEAWMKLTYQVLPYGHVERARFDDRMRAGLKAGKLCVPLWGKGVPLSEEATTGHAQLNLVRSNHPFTAGKYAIIQSQVPAEFDTWDLCLVDSVSGARLNLTGQISHDYPAGTYVWPLLFGKPIPDKFDPINTGRTRYSVAVQFDGRQINAVAADDFESYELGDVNTPLSSGVGWAGEWVLGRMAA